MGITFSTDLPAPEGTTDSPCLCAQMTNAFIQLLHGEDSADIRRELAEGADVGCPRCSGTGVEEVSVESPHQLNMNLYGFRVLSALGLSPECCGQCTIAEARRGLLRARNQDVSHLLTEDESRYGAPRENEDGTVELRPLRGHMTGLSRDDLFRRFDAFQRFVQSAAEAGATLIRWS